MARHKFDLVHKTWTIVAFIFPILLVTFYTWSIDFSAILKATAKSQKKAVTISVASSCVVDAAHTDKYKALKQSASHKNGTVAFKLARLYKSTKGTDCQELAFKWFETSAKWGEVKAYAEIGNAYSKGRGIERNFDLAVENFHKSAQHGYVSSVFSLVHLLEKGINGKKADLDQARHYLLEFMPLIEKGIQSGNAIATRSLARLYHRSKLLKRDISRAIELYELAAKADDSVAQHDLALILLAHRKAKTKSKRVISLLNNSARLGYAAAYTALGRLHLKSEFNLPKAEAIYWFERGIESGHGGAFQELAKLYQAGDLVEQNFDRATSLALEGAKLGHQGSIRLLSQMQQEGIIDADHIKRLRGS